MTTSPVPTPSAAPAAAPTGRPLRLALDPGEQSGPVDGAWWPRSRDLAVELADLVDAYPRAGLVTRLLVSRPDWDAPDPERFPRRFRAARGPVKVGSFPGDDTHSVVLSMLSGQRVQLVVVPPGLAEADAVELMQRAADPANRRTAAELVAGAVAPR